MTEYINKAKIKKKKKKKNWETQKAEEMTFFRDLRLALS